MTKLGANFSAGFRPTAKGVEFLPQTLIF